MRNIHYGVAHIDGMGRDVDVRVPAINIDNFYHTVSIVTEVHMKVMQRTISMEYAIEIGFINLKVLEDHKII